MFQGFSKLSKAEKQQWLVDEQLLAPDKLSEINSYAYSDAEQQEKHESFSENVIGNFHMPFSVAPNFLINGQRFVVPMVSEESSVVAAAAAAARFWWQHGGFHCKVKGTEKLGHIFFCWNSDPAIVENLQAELEIRMQESTMAETANMQKRGGGITKFKWLQHSMNEMIVFELRVAFQTGDAMGANFINTCMEKMLGVLNQFFANTHKASYEPIMSILSNYTPGSLVECFVEAPSHVFNRFEPLERGDLFTKKFKLAVDIADKHVYRAVTHNKGIFNGITAVLLATGNDFRAVDAAGHAYAAREGKYASLTQVALNEDVFRLTLRVPLAIGTVGGLTRQHPMAEKALEILKFPDAEMLMQVVAAVGLASHFSAIKALITDGIQLGHMKMHLGNILYQLNASPEQVVAAERFFKNRKVSVSAIRSFLNQ